MNSNNDSYSLNEIKIRLGENDEMYTVPINVNANAEEVAFAFCKDHNINYSYLPTLTQTISSFLIKRKQNKRLFSVQEFIKRIKEKNEKKDQSKMMMTNKTANTSSVNNEKTLKTCTIIDNKKHFDIFVYNRRSIVDNMYNQLNVILPKRNKNHFNVIDSSEMFLSFEQSSRSKRENLLIKDENVKDKCIRDKGNKILKVNNRSYVQLYLNSNNNKDRGNKRMKINN